jgi:hypothetical protein
MKINSNNLHHDNDQSLVNKSTENSFQDVWTQVASDPLDVLPQDKVSFGKLVSWGKNIILEDANRTLQEHADILNPFDKLAHPNGICLKGIWEIHKENRYSGYFKNHSKALIIARASSALSNTHRGEIRSFGFAGKIFPTMNPHKINRENTANFFLIDDLGGTDAEHYTDIALTNEPTASINSEVLKNLFYALELANAFAKVDENPGIRQLYEISELGEKNNGSIITPKWMKVEAKAGQTVDAKDFRDELRIAPHKKLVFHISVASKENSQGKKEWQTIGTITFDTSVVSTSCDHRLHFHHPKWRSDLNYGDL